MEINYRLFLEIAGWVPAIVFPIATFLQLFKILKEKSADGISLIAWLLFGFSNIGLYLYAEKYFSLQSIFGLLGTAFIDFLVVGCAIILNRKKHIVSV